jgi:hypothetical protein
MGDVIHVSTGAELMDMGRPAPKNSNYLEGKADSEKVIGEGETP